MAEENEFGFRLNFDSNSQVLNNLVDIVERLERVLTGAKEKVQELGGAEKTTDAEGKQLTQTLEKQEKQLDKTGQKLDKTKKQTKELGGGFDDAMKKVQKFGQALVALWGVQKGIAFAKNSMSAFETQFKSELQLGTTLNNLGFAQGSLNAFRNEASAIQGRTIYGDEAMLAGFNKMAKNVKDKDALLRMGSILADFAAEQSGMSAVDATGMASYGDLLGRAMAGQYMMLRRSGLNTQPLEEISGAEKALDVLNSPQATAKEKASAQAFLNSMDKNLFKKIREAGDKVTDAIKVDALEEVMKPFKGMSETIAKTPIGKMQQMQNLIGDYMENVGAKIYGSLSEVFDNKGIIGNIESFVNEFGNLITETISLGVTMIPTLEAIMKGLSVIAKGWANIFTLINGTVNWLLHKLGGGESEEKDQADFWAGKKTEGLKVLNKANNDWTRAQLEYNAGVIDDEEFNKRRESVIQGVREWSRINPDYARDFKQVGVSDSLKDLIKDNGLDYSKLKRSGIYEGTFAGKKDIGDFLLEYQNQMKTPKGVNVDDYLNNMRTAMKGKLTINNNTTNIKQTNNIDSNFDAIGRLIKENLREILISHLTFEQSSKNALAGNF